MQEKNDKQESKCPFHRFFRQKSGRQGIGAITYVYWNSLYAVVQYLNHKLSFDPNCKISWHKWPKYLGLVYVMAKLRFNRSNALTDPYDYQTNDTKDLGPEPEEAKRYISADGTWVSDRDDPRMGAANTRFSSNIPNKKVRPDVENMTPSAREAGKLRWRRIDESTGKEITIPALILNDLAGWWIQFQFHGFGGNTKRDSVSACPYMLRRSPQDNWTGGVAAVEKNSVDTTRLTDNGRPTIINERTVAWIQAQFYGTNESEADALRSFADGKLLVDQQGNLPEDPQKPGIDLTGFNHNYSPGLSFLHWLFVNEHNAIADHYKYFHPDWDDEQLYQMSRKVNVAQVARIHTVQWTEDLLQHPALQLAMHIDWYGMLGQRLKMYLMRLSHRHRLIHFLLTPLRHNDFIWGMTGSRWEHHDGPYQLPTQFRMVYRLHEMILGEHEIIEPGTNRTLDRIQLLDFIHHNTRPIVEKYGYETLAWSFVSKSCGALKLHNFPRALTQFENQQDGTLTDLSERDIFRERTDGTGTYNEFRMSLGEPPVTSFLELTGGDAELARELELKYEGDVEKVDAGIGILVEPKPQGFALGFTQFYQFILNAPRRVKSNRFLSEGYTYEGYEEGMDWVEHGGGFLGVMARHVPGIKPMMEGVVRGFSPWQDVETFPARMFIKTHAHTANVFKSDLVTLLLGWLTLSLAVWCGALSQSVATVATGALVIAPIAQTVWRMLAMRFMQQVWKRCYTDKRGFMFGTLYKAERWINRAAIWGGAQALVVMCGFGSLAWMLHDSQPVIALFSLVTALSGISTWRLSASFAKDAQVLKVSLRNRMRDGKPPRVNVANSRNESELELLFRLYAPGRDYMTAYDFARMHEGNRVRKHTPPAQLANTLQTKLVMLLYADRIVEEDRHLVPAVSRKMLLSVLDGTAKDERKQERQSGQIRKPGRSRLMKKNTANATGLGWKEKFEGGSAAAEEAMIQTFVTDIQELQRINQSAANAKTPQRTFHARPRVSVSNAEFRVSPNIPEHLRVGFLQPGSTYRTTVRFSNASGVAKPDTKKDLRGAALKLHLEDGSSQDFLMTNAAASHARTALQFMQFAKAGSAGKLKMIPNLIGAVGLRETIRIMVTVIRQSSRRVKSLATEAFWGRAPYAFGNYAVKYALFPGGSCDFTPTEGPDYLREDLVERLRQGPVVYDFRVQHFVNEDLTPIEDGVVEWKEDDSPFVTIAQLYIPQQDLTTDEAAADEAAIGELAFNPWNTIAEIRPLGSLNRARKLVYGASAAGRQAGPDKRA